jgi:hypothetical protein
LSISHSCSCWREDYRNSSFPKKNCLCLPSSMVAYASTAMDHHFKRWAQSSASSVILARSWRLDSSSSFRFAATIRDRISSMAHRWRTRSGAGMGAVARAAVAHETFSVLMRLRRHRRQALLEVRTTVVARHDDGDEHVRSRNAQCLDSLR